MSRFPTGESVLARAVRIIEAFKSGETTLTVSQIAQRAGLPISTTSRLIGELVQHGLLTRGDDREVQIGIRMWELGLRASRTLDLRQTALPIMRELNKLVGHHIQLGVLDGNDVLVLESVSALNSFANPTRVADRLAANATSTGVVLLAHTSADRQKEALRQPLRTYTQHTISTSGQLRVALAEAQRNGFAAEAGSVHPDITGITAPIRGARRSVVAGLSVILPKGEGALPYTSALIAAARRLTAAIALHHSAVSTRPSTCEPPTWTVDDAPGCSSLETPTDGDNRTITRHRR